MEQIVRVTNTFPDGTAQVLHLRQSACSGDCHKCSGCGAAQEALSLRAVNAIGARAGDMVAIEAATGPVLKAAAVMYLLPVGLFFLGYFLGMLAWGKGGLAGCLAFALGIGLAVCYDRRVVRRTETNYMITRFAGQPSCGTVE